MSTPTPDAPAAEWLVYADALQQRGDPLGELIALGHAGDTGRRDAHLRAHAATILGPLAPFLERGLRLDWRWGLLARAELKGDSAELLLAMTEALLASPLAAHLEAVRLIGVTREGPWDAPQLTLAPVVARLARTKVASLALIDARAADSHKLIARDFEPGPNLVDFGPLAPLWAMGGLRALELVVADVRQLEPGAISAPTLESLTVRGLRFARAQRGGAAEPNAFATALGNAALPALTHCELRLCEEWLAGYLDDEGAYLPMNVEPYEEPDEGSNEGSDWEGELGAALGTLARSRVTRLALTSFDSTGALLGALATHGLPPALEELDLSDSSLGDDDVAWFEAHAALIGPVKRLVAKATRLTAAGAARLEALGPRVEFSTSPARQLPFDGDDGEPMTTPMPTWRYVVGME